MNVHQFRSHLFAFIRFEAEMKINHIPLLSPQVLKTEMSLEDTASKWDVVSSGCGKQSIN
jgi:hypothetical protein